MNVLDLSKIGGLPFVQNDLDYLAYSDGGLLKAIEGFLQGYGSDFIVSGCVLTGTSMTSGWLMLNNELLKVDAHTTSGNYFEKVTTYPTDGVKQFRNGVVESTYKQQRATLTALSGTFAYTETVQNKNNSRMYDNINTIRRGAALPTTTGWKRIAKIDNTYFGSLECRFFRLSSYGNVVTFDVRFSFSTGRTNAFGTAGLWRLVENSGYYYIEANYESTSAVVYPTDVVVYQNASNFVEVYSGELPAGAQVGDSLRINPVSYFETSFFATLGVSATSSYGKLNTSDIVTGNVQLFKKVIEIGDWDMDATNFVSIAHGISNILKIRGIDAIIVSDSGSSIIRLDSSNGIESQGSVTGINSVNIQLNRTTGGWFDSTDYNATSYNRGWVTITYEA